jgi:CubicO group peptidase (beta-lactamase class C family)
MLNIVAPETVGMSGDRLQRVTRWMNQLVDEKKLAGASVLIGRQGQIPYFETAGFSELEIGRPFEKDTIVRIYSMTKPVTSVAAMMLYEEGCFQLDDPVANYIPAFADTQVWTGGDADITSTVPQSSPMLVRHLLTHTSGLTYDFIRATPVDAQYREMELDRRNPDISLESWANTLASAPLIAQPGSAWNYSFATDVVGRLVEIWSGKSLDVFMQERIFEPLGMVDTGFVMREENRERFSALYAPKVGGRLGDPNPPPLSERGGLKLQESVIDSVYFKSPGAFSGGGGLVSTMHDYSRFCEMLMRGGELAGERILSPTTIRHMRTNHLPDNRDMAAMGQPVWSETSYDGIGFGLGFAVVLDPVGASIITSPGEHHWGGAASTFFWLDPVQDLYAIFLTQLMPSSTYPIRRQLRVRVYQAITEG